jgi:hypothetical protein
VGRTEAGNEYVQQLGRLQRLQTTDSRGAGTVCGGWFGLKTLTCRPRWLFCTACFAKWGGHTLHLVMLGKERFQLRAEVRVCCQELEAVKCPPCLERILRGLPKLLAGVLDRARRVVEPSRPRPQS